MRKIQIIDISYGFYYTQYSCKEAILPPEKFKKYIGHAIRLLESMVIEECSCDEDFMLCVCEIADFLYENAKTEGIKSESIDGYSRTFAESRNLRQKAFEIACKYKGVRDFMYAGVE